MIFFTSDTHYWHKRIIDLSKRPFVNLSMMHEALIENWNEKVRPEDTVYHLGDMSFAGRGHTMMILSQLNGRIKLLRGNHDRKAFLRPGLDEELTQYHELTHEGQKIVLCHYPLLTWNKAHKKPNGSWMLHGHCHGTIDEKWNKTTTRLDVGVDGVAGYAPLAFDEVAEIMRAKTYEIVDQHGVELTAEQIGEKENGE